MRALLIACLFASVCLVGSSAEAGRSRSKVQKPSASKKTNRARRMVRPSAVQSRLRGHSLHALKTHVPRRHPGAGYRAFRPRQIEVPDGTMRSYIQMTDLRLLRLWNRLDREQRRRPFLAADTTSFSLWEHAMAMRAHRWQRAWVAVNTVIDSRGLDRLPVR